MSLSSSKGNCATEYSNCRIPKKRSIGTIIGFNVAKIQDSNEIHFLKYPKQHVWFVSIGITFGVFQKYLLKESSISFNFLISSRLFQLGIVAIAMVLGSYFVTENYYTINGFFADPCMFLQKNVSLYNRMQAERGMNPLASRFYLSMDELLNNPINPFRTIPNIVLFPDSFGSKYAHLLTSIPFFLLFLGLFYHTIRIISKNEDWSLLYSIIFCLSPVFIHGKYGFAQYWLDLAPGFLVGACILLVLLWRLESKNSWLVGFSMLISVALMCRYISSVLCFILLFPAIIYIFYERLFFLKLGWKKGFFIPVSWLLISLGLFGSFGIIHYFDYNYTYYTTFNYGLKLGIKEAFLHYVEWWYFIVGFPFLILLCFWVLISTEMLKTKIGIDKFYKFFGLYILLIVPAFFVLLLQSAANWHVYSGLYPSVFIGIILFSIPSYKNSIDKRKLTWVLSSFALVWISYIYINFNKPDWIKASSKGNYKVTDNIISQNLNKLPVDTRWVSTIKEVHSIMLNLEIFFNNENKSYPNYINFYSSETLWKLTYGNLPPNKIASRLLNELHDKGSAIFIFKRNDRIESHPEYKDDFTRSIVKMIRDTITSNQLWHEQSKFNTQHGEISMFVHR